MTELLLHVGSFLSSFSTNPTGDSMSSISPAVQQVLQARQDVMRNEIDMALLGQHLDAQRQSGTAINQMIQDVAKVQKQITDGYIDVRV